MLRLYLDTSDLMAIGDGDVTPAVVDELLVAMAETSTMLLVTRAHLNDLTRATDAASVDRTLGAVERFAPVLTPTAGASATEPLSPPEHGDMELMTLCSFGQSAREALALWGERADEAYDRVHGVRDAARTLAAGAPSRGGGERVPLGALVWGLSLADLEREAATTVRELEARLPVALAVADRRALIEALRLYRRVLPDLRAIAGGPDTLLGELFERTARPHGDPARWPGHALALAVAATLERDPRRKLLRSDLADTEHASTSPTSTSSRATVRRRRL